MIKREQTAATDNDRGGIGANFRSKIGSWARLFIGGLVIVLVFGLGMGVGSGRIDLGLHGQSISSNSDLPSRLDMAKVHELYSILKSKYDGKLNEAELIDGLRRGLINAAGDQYTEFFSASEAAEFNRQLEGTFSGIGAELGKNENDNLVIVAPIKGYPAEKAGLRSKDVIASINGKSTAGKSVTEAVNKIRGKVGTDVELGIIRGESGLKTYTITRADITIPSVNSEIISNGQVGYLQINQFWNDTAELAKQAAQDFKSAGVKSVIVDLRGNPGGSLDAAVDVSSIWLQPGATVLQEKRDGKVIKTYQASDQYAKLLQGIKTVVLIDEGSASASEIVAGALHDNKAATLVGQTSYGKGSVQQIISLSDGSQVKITFARWFTPGGKNIDKTGIKPDHQVKLTEADLADGVDRQKNKALQLAL